MKKRTTVSLEAGKVLTVTANAVSSGHVVRESVSAGQEPQSSSDISASSTSVFGPYNQTERFAIQSNVGELTYSSAASINPTPVKAQTASYTLTADDANALITMNNASALTLTVPPDSSVLFPVGTEIAMQQLGAGALTVVAGAGVTINCASTLVLSGQHATAALKKTAANTWVLAGNLV